MSEPNGDRFAWSEGDIQLVDDATEPEADCPACEEGNPEECEACDDGTDLE